MGGAVAVPRLRRDSSQRNSGVPPCSVCETNHVGKEIEVIFVRHGQSQWNFAQKNWLLWDMAKRRNHPLSSEGRRQCEELRYKIQEFDDFPPVEVIFSSPLARAIETAILVFPNHLRGRAGNREDRLSLVLLPTAREKLNFFGRDSECVSVGEDLVNGSFNNLTSLYDTMYSDDSPTFTETTTGGTTDLSPNSNLEHAADCEEDLSNLDQEAPIENEPNVEMLQAKVASQRSIGSKRASILADRMMCHIDVSNVQEQWCRGTSAVGEGLSPFLARLDEFMHQLMHTNFKSMCVVGHSHFIRMVFRQYFTQELCARKNGLTSSLQKSLVPNCGVVKCKIRCEEGGRLAIVDVDVLYDTTIPTEAAQKPGNCGIFGSCRASQAEDELVVGDANQAMFAEDLELEDSGSLRRTSVGSLPAVPE